MDNPLGTLNEFIQGMGALCEIWMLTYSSFKKQNLNDAEAMEHTKAFMSVMMHETMHGGSEKESNND